MSLDLGTLGYVEPLVPMSVTLDLASAHTYQSGGVAASATYPAANLAVFVPFRISQIRTYTRAWWLNGTVVAGNVDVGIYTVAGTTATRVVASTATAQATASVMQSVAIGPTTLNPGLYYLALSCTSTTSTFWRCALNATTGRTAGLYQNTAASPLPSTATVSAFAQSSFPIFGVSEFTL